MKIQANKREGKHPLAGIKKKRSSSAASPRPSATDLASAAHKANIAPGVLPSKIYQGDPVMDHPLTETDLLLAEDGQIAELASDDIKVSCPDAANNRIQTPAEYGGVTTLSECRVPFCAARNPRYAAEEHGNPTMESFPKIRAEVLEDAASLRSGIHDLRPGYVPKSVLDFGVGGCLDWEECRRDLHNEGFFQAIEARAMFTFDVEGYPTGASSKYTAEAVNNQVAVLHLMAPNGVMLQISVNHDGTSKGDPNERAVPEESIKLFARETVIKFGFGAVEDAERLMRSEVIKEIRSVTDAQNLALAAFPQFEKQIKDIATGKKQAAKELNSPVLYVDALPKGGQRTTETGATLILTGFRNKKWDFTLPFNRWADEMVHYNRHDHCLAWVLLHQCALRFAKLEKHKGDLLRAELYLLALMRNWRPRIRAQDLTANTARPFADWFHLDEEVKVVGFGTSETKKMRAHPFFYHEAWFNSIEETFSFMMQLDRRWESDREGMQTERFDILERLLTALAPQRNAMGIITAYYNGPAIGQHAPHACAHCGSSHHRTKFCSSKLEDLTCDYCGSHHQIKVCP